MRIFAADFILQRVAVHAQPAAALALRHAAMASPNFGVVRASPLLRSLAGFKKINDAIFVKVFYRESQSQNSLLRDLRQ